jgi:YD repeat-containing protein
MNPHASSGRALLRRLLRPALLLLPLAVAPPAAALQIRYAYDDAGRLLEADYGGGQTIAYGYDANGNLVLRSATAGAEFMLVYTALAGGTLDGVATQLVAPGGSGSAVTAVTNPYYAFVQWSDGLGTAARTDVNVQSNLAVSAEFAAILAAGGTPLWWLADQYPDTNDFDAAEASDDDVDGFTAGQEYAADTDPNAPGDYFFVADALPPAAANAIRFTSSTGRLYVLQGRTPALESWSNLPGRGPRLGLGGADGMEPLPDSPAQLYRVRVQVP